MMSKSSWGIFFIVILTFGFGSISRSQAQNSNVDFCEAITAILRDAPNKFRNVRTNVVETGLNAMIYKSGVPVPGVISARFVANMGNFYEGGLVKTDSVYKLRTVYQHYDSLLNDCLGKQGFKRKYLENVYPGLEDYQKIAFFPPVGDAENPAPIQGHVTVEAQYVKEMRAYFLILFIYEH